MRNTGAKVAFQSCPDHLDHWRPQAGAASHGTSRGTNKNIQHHMTRTLPFSENFSMVLESGVLKQDVAEAILLFPGRKGTSYEYTGLQFNVLLFKSSAFFACFVVAAEVALIRGHIASALSTPGRQGFKSWLQLLTDLSKS